MIDADELEKWIEEDIKAIENRDPVMAMAGVGCLNMVKRSPTIEPRHGKWVDVAKTEMYDKTGIKTWGIVYQCNLCGFIVNAVEGHIGQYNYCPQCGAKMDKE